MTHLTNKTRNQSCLLGNIQITPETFPDVEAIIASFKEKQFLSLSWRKRFRAINEALCKLITDSSPKSFLLTAVLDFIDRINQSGVAKETYNVALFEFWLNNFSNLSDSENFEIRARIAGKFVPRSEYQGIFPIGMNKTYTGSHFVISHLSPDIDTMVASFWGWLDAFAARIGTSLHQWFLPDGPPDSPFTSIFQKMIGQNLFKFVPRTTSSLSLTSLDLVNQKKLIKISGETLMSNLNHEDNSKAIIVIDDQGHFLGDWRPSDIELTGQITVPFKSYLRWIENNLHSSLISLFAKENLNIRDFPEFYENIFNIRIGNCEPTLELNQKQVGLLDTFLQKIFGLHQGLEASFQDLNSALKMHSNSKMANFQIELEKLCRSKIFDENGQLKENRPEIFNQLKNIIAQLDDAAQEVRNYIERLDVQLKIKHEVLGIPRIYLTMKSDVEEMRTKMENHHFLTVVIPETDGGLFPVGVVRSSELTQKGLATVTFRDFCNFDEVKMSSYFEVISVMDHHKNSLKTTSVPSAIIADVQSCNILLAEQAFLLNDKYSLGGLTEEEIHDQLKNLPSFSSSTASEMRIHRKLMQRALAAQYRAGFYINPSREYCEYLCFLQAILDDTDLLTKVSIRDLSCIAELLNRLKSLSLGKEVEIISLDDIPRDEHFTSLASERILKQPDMYSLYKYIYKLKEESIRENLELCINGKHSNLFVDTKIQNGCARVGQTKLFMQNFPYFLEHAKSIRKTWADKSQSVQNEYSEIDLHIHMISTIASAEEVYKGQIGPYDHLDELWFWIPAVQSNLTHLNNFLVNFHAGVKKALGQVQLEFIGNASPELVQIFTESFSNVKPVFSTGELTDCSMAILRFTAGKLNSRKSMITPFLPRLVT